MEFSEEAWVLKDLKVPILLGEDFHINYQISTIQNDLGSCLSLHHHDQLYSIPTHSAPSELAAKEVSEEHAKLQAIVTSIKKAASHKKQAKGGRRARVEYV